MAQRQQDLFWFDFLLRVHNVLFIGGLVIAAVYTTYAVGGQWIAGAMANPPVWAVYSRIYSDRLFEVVFRFAWFNWYIVIPMVYGSAIWVTKRLWY